MAIRNIRKENDELLRKKSKEVDIVDDKIREIIKDMMDTMHKFDGLGLAAPQIGLLKRIIVIDLYEDGPKLALINPVLKEVEGVQIVGEGCLSFPNKFGQVERPETVTVVGLDEYGKKTTVKATGLLAQTLSHEIDHLNGKLFIDKILPGTLEIVTPEDEEKRNI